MRAIELLALVVPASCLVQPDAPLASYFGFEPPRTIVVDDRCGPLAIADLNADNRPDLLVVNNAKSRIELHTLRATERRPEESAAQLRANELPPNPWYEREFVSISNRVGAIVSADVDADGKPEIIAAGTDPSEIVIFARADGAFKPAHRRRVRGLEPQAEGLAVADVLGDERPELLAIVDGQVHAFGLGADGVIGEPTMLGAGDGLHAVFAEDFNGDSRTDVLAIAPDHPAPVRLWLQSPDPRSSVKLGLLPAEYRFEMPALSSACPVRFANRAAASVGVIERASRRMVFADVVMRPASGLDVGSIAEREVQAEITPFADGAKRDRSVAIGDIDGDGLLDLLATDSRANNVTIYRQERGVGLRSPIPFATFRDPKQIAIGEWDSLPGPEFLVLSENEKAAGVSRFDRALERLGFPEPLTVATAGGTPVAMQHVDLGTPTAALVVKDKRDHFVELHQPGKGAATIVPLKDATRPPQTILAIDADRDGKRDLLLLTPNEAMIMVRSSADAPLPSQVMTQKEMPQFGLVQAAGPDNTAVVDLNSDGWSELLIADQNFVRACSYDPSTGWKVLDQINVNDAGTALAGLAVVQDAGRRYVVASDKGNGRLLVFGPDERGVWALRGRVRVLGFPVGPIRAGAFGGDASPCVLCLGDDAFAVVRFAGDRPALEPFGAFRADSETRREHAIRAGDLNGDGYTDAVVLDAAEQMFQVLTFTKTRKPLHATEFKVFESRLFGAGDEREFEPSAVLIADATGDDADDAILLCHDRVLIYPQKARN